MPKKVEKIKRYLIFCEPCSYKKIVETDKPEDLVIIKRSAVPRGEPKIDPATKKVKVSKSQPQMTMCKCPQCGRGATLKNLPDVYSRTLEKLDEAKRKAQEELERQQRIEDGKPHERMVDEDFIG